MVTSTSHSGLRDFECARLRLARGSVEGGDSLATAFRSTTELAADTIRVERCGIWLFVEERRAIRCFDLFERSSRRHSEGTVLRAQDFPAYFGALERMRVVQADEAAIAPATAELDAAYLSPLGIGAMLDAPLFRNGRVVGVVCHEHVGPPRSWTAKEVDFVSSVSDTVALEMEAAALRDAEVTLRAREAQLAELRKWEALGRLAAGVAHDFRNVLVSVMAHAAILVRDHRSPPEHVVDAQAILALAEQGADLAKELMSLGSDSPHVPSVIDVADTVVSSAAMLRSILRGSSSELKIETGRTHARVFMDRTDIRRILFNLVGNSRDAMTSGGTVEVRVDEIVVEDSGCDSAVFVVLVIRDTGAGMDDTTLARAFDPFFSTKADGRGTGLGLSIVRSIVDRVGGFVRVESEPRVGTTVRVYIPRISSEP
jgi:two-component system, cell cycle sensor histidine kinase and response regulator CckA